MTEEGYKWFQRTCLYARFVPDGAQRREVAEFWISVLYSTVTSKAKTKCKHVVTRRPCDHCLAEAFEEHYNDTREMP